MAVMQVAKHVFFFWLPLASGWGIMRSLNPDYS